MELLFKKPEGRYTFHKNLLVSYWMTKGVFLNERQVDCHYNTFHDFWDVTIKRGPLFKTGHGSVKSQIQQWDTIVDKLSCLHRSSIKSVSDGWTWNSILDEVFLDGQKVCNGKVFCPTMRFHFKNKESE